MQTIIRCASGLALVGAGLVMFGGCGSPEGQHERVGRVHQAAGEFVVINEIDAYPPGSESSGAPNTQRDPWWYVELKGTPGLDLTNYYFVQVVGIYSDSQYGNTGKVVGIEIDLGSACGGSACQLGSNGLLLLRDTAGAGGEFVASQDTDTPVVDGAFDAFWPESNSYLLIHSPSPLNPGGVTLDFDPANDGTLTLPAGAQLIDAVGWKSGYKPQDFVYGGVACAQQDYAFCIRCAGKFEVPAAATRLPGDNTPLSASAWYCGAIAGEQPEGLNYDALPNASTNLPDGAVLTPGAENYPTSGTGGSSGAGGSAGQGGAAGQGGSGGSAGSAGTAGSGGSGGSAGTAGSGGSAGTAGSGGSAGTAGSGGSAGTAGLGGSAGTAGSGGSVTAGSGGSATAGSGGNSTSVANAKEDDTGCGCSTPSSRRPSGALAIFALAGLVVVARRRRQFTE